VALISHLPVLASAALLTTADAEATRGSAEGLPELTRLLASSGFADTTRVGGGNPSLGTLMAQCNRDAVLQALRGYLQAIETMETLVEQEDWPRLQQVLADAAGLRAAFL
jgi:arogenate dehydrogenase (NADP+)